MTRAILLIILFILIVSPLQAQGPIFLPLIVKGDCMVAVLEITDDTTTVDFINPGKGIHLNDWTPQIAQPKGGGVVQSSTLAEGTRLREAVYDDVIETFNFKVDDLTQDQLIERMAELLRLLEKARQYWTTDWQNTLVYLKAQASCETNPRYIIVKNYSIPQLENPYSQPFLQANKAAVFNEIDLLITRGHWQAEIPGTATAIEISSQSSYDGRTLGREATTANEVFLANKQNIANITDVNRDDGGVFSANLMDAALPYDLFPAAPALNDAILFGIDSSIADSGQFAALVFDIGTAATGTFTLTWEFFNGAAWGVLTVQDNTNEFRNTGVNSVHWNLPNIAGWAVGDPGTGITGYWVRARISAFTSMATIPTQQNRDVYTLTRPSLDVDSAQVAGDIEALLQMKVYDGVQSPINIFSETRLTIGLRSESRGSNFVPYINLSDEQNPTGITISTGVNTSIVSDLRAPSGRSALFNPAGAEGIVDRVTIAFSSSLIVEYYGQYHAYLRVGQTGGAVGDFGVRLQMTGGATTATKFVNGTNDWNVIDLGKVTIPGTPINTSEAYNAFTIDVQASNSNAAPGDLYMYDLILIPTDEWSGDYAVIDSPTTEDLRSRYLDIDSLLFPKQRNRAILRLRSNDEVVTFWRPVTNGLPFLQANVDQQLYFLASRVISDEFHANPWLALNIELFDNERYLGMRGSQ